MNGPQKSSQRSNMYASDRMRMKDILNSRDPGHSDEKMTTNPGHLVSMFAQRVLWDLWKVNFIAMPVVNCVKIGPIYYRLQFDSEDVANKAKILLRDKVNTFITSHLDDETTNNPCHLVVIFTNSDDKKNTQEALNDLCKVNFIERPERPTVLEETVVSVDSDAKADKDLSLQIPKKLFKFLFGHVELFWFNIEKAAELTWFNLKIAADLIEVVCSKMKHLISFVQKIDPPREIKYGFDVNSAENLHRVVRVVKNF